jgi:hypothetical protein
MGNFQSIEQLLIELDTNIVYKTKKSIVAGLLFILAGIGCFVPLSIFSWAPHNMVPQFLIVLGTIGLTVGLFKTFIRKEFFVATASQQPFKSFEINFEITETGKLVNLCNTRKITDIHTLKRSLSGGLKLRVLSTQDRELCFSQVIGFESLEHAMLTPPVQHSKQEADYLFGLHG